MWKGRFQSEPSSLLTLYGESISFDWRLYKHDILGSISHAKALQKKGIINDEELQAITNGLESIGKDIEEGTFEFDTSLEDIHMNIESELTERIGETGAKLHTARSRNDQVSLDMRMYCKDELNHIINQVKGLQSSLINSCERFSDAVIPGYTHLQRGQPVLFGHHLLSYIEMLARDNERISDAIKRIDVMPLGSGALAGSTISLDREFVAKDLGFSKISQNSMDAVSDRDFVAETLFCLAMIGVHLSRLSEDIILWSSAEFNFVTLDDRHTTGSSLMPQKKNPDIAELTRGKTGRLNGNLISIMTTLKGLPMTYNRDLQEDKEPLFDSIDTIQNAVAIFSEMIEAMEVNKEKTSQACSDPFLFATDIADYLVLRGVPFREAHKIVGKLTAHSVSTKTPFQKIKIDKYHEFSSHFDEGVFQLFNIESALNSREATGAPSPKNMAKQIDAWKEKLVD